MGISILLPVLVLFFLLVFAILMFKPSIRKKFMSWRIHQVKNMIGEENIKEMRDMSDVASKEDIEALKQQIADLKEAGRK